MKYLIYVIIWAVEVEWTLFVPMIMLCVLK